MGFFNGSKFILTHINVNIKDYDKNKDKAIRSGLDYL